MEGLGVASLLPPQPHKSSQAVIFPVIHQEVAVLENETHDHTLMQHGAPQHTWPTSTNPPNWPDPTPT
ncbi:hypothetical protein Pmani_030251 [Petrolisthes manimaculis]|uniref:Uncharacterized protein n=1 Tax=Petrolisthes manimaculis TaxID=1843537 RepID=A0AAE1NXW0_9EUCA|nr:hypothetical protein Pmani_030251 [Petrolisthes manimaculis]